MIKGLKYKEKMPISIVKKLKDYDPKLEAKNI